MFTSEDKDKTLTVVLKSGVQFRGVVQPQSAYIDASTITLCNSEGYHEILIREVAVVSREGFRYAH